MIFETKKKKIRHRRCKNKIVLLFDYEKDVFSDCEYNIQSSVYDIKRS